MTSTATLKARRIEYRTALLDRIATETGLLIYRHAYPRDARGTLMAHLVGGNDGKPLCGQPCWEEPRRIPSYLPMRCPSCLIRAPRLPSGGVAGLAARIERAEDILAHRERMR